MNNYEDENIKYIKIENGKQKVINMKKVNQITGDQVVIYIKKHIGNLMFMAPALGFLLSMVVATWGQPYLEKQIKKKTDPIQKAVNTNTQLHKETKFTMAQILLILEKTNDKSLIDEVKAETERFRPKAANKTLENN